MKVVYDGPFDAVEVPALGIVANRGEPIEAGDLGPDLVKQECWNAAKRGSGSDQ